MLYNEIDKSMTVPARVGGVDLSTVCYLQPDISTSPRPCGRGGFKHYEVLHMFRWMKSPPVWAGWI